MNDEGEVFKPLARLNYYAGRLLTASDFAAEQAYVLEKQRRHNRLLHGSGVAAGLGVSVDEAAGQVVVSAGVALDCMGREVVVPQPVAVALPAECERVYVGVAYDEALGDPMPAVEGEPMPGSIVEGFALKFVPVRDLRPHGRHGRAWQACGLEHPVPLARLLCRDGAWQVDKRFRAARVGG